LAYFGALRVATTQVADYNLLTLRVNMRNLPRAGINAFAAARALVHVNNDGAGFLVYGKSFEWTRFNAWVVLALRA
jgi:hypothetical protein